MGSAMSNFKRDDDAECTSDEDPDYSYIRTRPQSVSREMNCELDAVSSREVTSAFPTSTFDFSAIAEQLSNYEKISLIYLLNDDPEEALRLMEEVESSSGGNINFAPAAFNLGDGRNKEKLIEALCIIQNYEVARKEFGQLKHDLVDRYLPLQRCSSLTIDRIRKCLYRLFEDMSEKNTADFLRVVKKELKDRYRDFPYLEMYFSYFETIEFITRDNFENIEKALISIEKDTYYRDLQELSNSGRIRLDQGPGIPEIGGPYNRVPGSGGGRKSSLSAYPMDPDSPGIVAIIENEFFYTECDEKFQEQVEPSTSKIADRVGSGFDSKRLHRTFSRFNFKIVHKSNMTHEEMLDFVKKVAHEDFQKNDSCLFICLLSHGKEDKVFASNSVPVTIDSIKKQLHSPNLHGKPKVLIIQSCRGNEIQTLTTDCASSEVTDNVLTIDAPLKPTPPTVDFLEIWSTVPGYASIRDPNNGTWFIQTLCNVIDESDDGCNMHDICTKTRERLLDLEWKVKSEIRVMVCENRETLTKLLFLPPVARSFRH